MTSDEMIEQRKSELAAALSNITGDLVAPGITGSAEIITNRINALIEAHCLALMSVIAPGKVGGT